MASIGSTSGNFQSVSRATMPNPYGWVYPLAAAFPWARGENSSSEPTPDPITPETVVMVEGGGISLYGG